MMNARLSTLDNRWVTCPRSVASDARFLTHLKSDAEIEDDKTHYLLSVCIKERTPVESLIGTSIGNMCESLIVDKKRADRVKVALDYIYKQTEELIRTIPGSECYVEAETKTSPGSGMTPPRKDWYGVCDVTITVVSKLDNKVLFIEVIDFDDRRRYRSINNDPRMLGLLRGKTYHLKDLTSLKMTIIQPKAERQISSQTFTTWSLEPEIRKLEVAVLATDDINAELIPGDQCMYCKHKPICKGIEDKNLKVINTMDNSGGDKVELSIIRLVHTELTTMTNEQLENILDSEKVFIDAFQRAKVEASNRLNSGGTINGWFMGKGSGKKVWNEEPEVIARKLKGMKLIKDEIFPAKLITPAQALKLELSPTRRKNLEKLIEIETGKASLKSCDKYEDDMFGVNQISSQHSDQPVTKTADEMFSVDDVPDFLPTDEQEPVTKTAAEMFETQSTQNVEDTDFNFL